MIPGIESSGEPNGISRVIENYYKYAPTVGIKFVGDYDEYDLVASHAGITGSECDVSILHGLYFTGDYKASNHEYIINNRIVDSVRSAKAITVPSSWVAEIIQRDMHINPFVVPHGIDYKEWDHDYQDNGYVLYNKNRDGFDVCDSSQVDRIAEMAGDITFISTFSKSRPSNVIVTGVLPHGEMKNAVQKSAVYLSVTKETFGIGVLEALASGVPVLGWRSGGNVDIISHGINGYLAEPGNYDDLLNGLRYIFKYRKTLHDNAKLTSEQWSWQNSIRKLRSVFEYALEKRERKVSVSVIIPTYNYGDKIDRALTSVYSQTLPASEVIVVDDGSTQEHAELTKEACERFNAKYIRKDNGGVATARNLGAKRSSGKYLCFLDPDDAIDKDFLRVCVSDLEGDPSLYIAYTSLKWIDKDGNTGVSAWPADWHFDEQLKRKNQVPTCNVMRREVIERTGGFRQRYAPNGAGSEDADLWTRAGSLGMKARRVTKDALFIYSVGQGNVSGDKTYREVDWLGWNGYIQTGLHPFASYASPRMGQSHNVYQYDHPVVSVIIPVGPGHEDKIFEAIDSVEGQTLKRWELILVNDSGTPIDITPYPFVRYIETRKPKSGPGVARNMGELIARGRFLFFLDADDWIAPNALEIMLSQWNISKSIVYSNYYGIATIEDEDYLNKLGDRLVDYNPKNHKAKILHRAEEYDCKRAQEQPNDPLYHWCIVSCLIPREYHKAIGGFDETMKSWEDVDYHWRMSHNGYCYSKIDDPLVAYRFDTGNRRNAANPDTNLDTAKSLLSYMKTKYKGIKMANCTTCGGQRTQAQIEALMSSQNASGGDGDYVLAVYNHPNKGDHSVIGPSTGIRYGYRSGGDSFLVHKKDIELMPMLFIVNDRVNGGLANDLIAPVGGVQNTPEPTPIAAPKPKVFDINLVPGITPSIAKKLTEAGFNDEEKFKALTEEELKDIDGISVVRAKVIMSIVQEMNE